MVRFLLRLPGVRQLHGRQFLFPLLLVGIVAAVLAHGALEVRPVAGAAPDVAHAPDGAEAVVAEAPDPPRLAGTRPALRGDLEKTPLTYFSDYWAQLLAEVGVHLISVGAEAHAGVVVAPGVAVVTAAAAAELSAAAVQARLLQEAAGIGEDEAAAGPTAVAPDLTDPALDLTDEALDLTAATPDPTDGVVAVDRRSGLALVAAPPDVTPFETGSARALASGSYVGSVTLDASGAPVIAPGFLVSAPNVGEGDGAEGRERDQLVISAAPPRVAAVAAVVDLDGALIGISYRSAEGVRTLSAEALGSVVDRMLAGEPCRAIAVSVPSPAVADLLDVNGLLVESVLVEAFASEPGLRPGDVLVAWDGEPVTSADDFMARYDAAPAGEFVSYRVLRGRRRAIRADSGARRSLPPGVGGGPDTSRQIGADARLGRAGGGSPRRLDGDRRRTRRARRAVRHRGGRPSGGGGWPSAG